MLVPLTADSGTLVCYEGIELMRAGRTNVLAVAGLAAALIGASGLASRANGQDFLRAPEPGPIAKTETGVTREGEGARRTALNTRERQAFDPATWAKLSDWKNGKALTSTDTAGKVVLIITWTDYLPTGKRAVQAATRVAEKYKDDAIVVLAHSQQDWANAVKPQPAAGTLLVAHDEKGEFRKALDVDQDPDFYVIDRAGQLRFADITAEAVDGAVAALAKETKDEASSISTRLSDEAAKIDREFRRTSAINAEGTFVAIPELAFPAPSESDYTAVDWPPRPADEAKIDKDPRAELPTKQIQLPSVGWYPNKPELKGRAVLLYTWNPYYSGGFDSMPVLDQWQRQFGRDVVMVGVMVSAAGINGNRLTDEQQKPEKMMERFRDVCKSRQFEHYLVPSLDSNPWTVLNENGATEAKNVIGAVVILSSDGYARWWSHEKSRVAGLAALRDIIEIDPAITARRKVEAEWLKAHPKGGK